MASDGSNTQRNFLWLSCGWVITFLHLSPCLFISDLFQIYITIPRALFPEFSSAADYQSVVSAISVAASAGPNLVLTL